MSTQFLRDIIPVLIASFISGCSLFGPEEVAVSFDTVFQSDTAVRAAPPSQDVLVLRSPAEAEAFMEMTDLSVPLPAIDFSVSSFVVASGQSGASGARLSIVEILLVDNDRVQLTLQATGFTPVGTGGPAAFPIHIVVTDRIIDAGYAIETATL